MGGGRWVVCSAARPPGLCTCLLFCVCPGRAAAHTSTLPLLPQTPHCKQINDFGLASVLEGHSTIQRSCRLGTSELPMYAALLVASCGQYKAVCVWLVPAGDKGTCGAVRLDCRSGAAWVPRLHSCASSLPRLPPYALRAVTHMPPELIQHNSLSKAADVWAFGASLCALPSAAALPSTSALL